MDDATRMERLRALPSIDELLARPSLAPWFSRHSRSVAVTAARQAVASVRAQLLAGADVQLEERHVLDALDALATPRLQRVINATGVVLHTNLGRAPLAPVAIERMAALAAGYCNLELELESGERGERSSVVAPLLQQLTGAEACLVVNNGAAATLLVLSALGKEREVIVSRGELVEIGGGFRVPEVMAQSGAKMIEVGTTNRTHLADYERAIGPATALLVKVHQSNFAQLGFTAQVSTRELAQLGRGRGVPVYEDLGSGQLSALHGEGLGSEPTVRAVVEAGADVVSFSGDKLLGGPQAGLIVGRAGLIARIARHPLLRALRVDKLTLAALEATLALYRDGREDVAVPARMAMLASTASLRARAERLGSLTGGRVVPTLSRVGGGSLPLAEPAGFAVAVATRDAMALQSKLRAGTPPVVARIVDDEVWFDVRCVADVELDVLAQALAACTKEN